MNYVLLAFLTIAHLAYGQKPTRNFVLAGHIGNGDTLRQARLLNSVSGKTDSTAIRNGQFIFTGHVEYPCFAFISVDNVSQQVI